MSDMKAEPASFYLNGLSRYTFGDRWRYGVECEVQTRDVDTKRNKFKSKDIHPG